MRNTIHINNSRNILGIAGIESGVVSEGYDLKYIYDAKISNTTKEPDVFWCGTNLPAITFDLGETVQVEEIEIAFHLSSMRDTYFDIMVSVDGVNYSYLVEDGVVLQTPGTAVPSHSEYDTVVQDQCVLARYVMVKHRGHSAAGKDNVNAFNGIQEITIMGSALP